MSMLADSIRNRQRQRTVSLGGKEMEALHRYAGDLLADGYVSPIVLPCDRLKELRGEDSVTVMADRCRIPTRELEMLLDNDFLEPSVRHLVSISIHYDVPVLWLLGYHSTKARTSARGDRTLLDAISKRNAAEQTLLKTKQRGLLGEVMRGIAEARVHRYSLLVSMTAARMVAAQHVPISNAEMRLMRGQPVFIEHAAGEMEWGLVFDGQIQALSGTLPFEANGTEYQVYQTPNTAVSEVHT